MKTKRTSVNLNGEKEMELLVIMKGEGHKVFDSFIWTLTYDDDEALREEMLELKEDNEFFCEEVYFLELNSAKDFMKGWEGLK